MAAADLGTTLLGDVPETFVDLTAANASPAYEVNHILAGFLYGMTEENHLTELEACYAGGSEIEHELMTAIGDFKAGGWNNITQGVLEIVTLALQVPQELHTCESMQDDLGAIKEWAAIFTNKGKLISHVTKHYLTHKKQVTADIKELKSDFSGELFFQTGEDVATIVNLLVGPIQK